MTRPTLTRIYATVLGFLLVWPAFQWVLVTRFDIDPWKGVGFAMYTMHHRIEVRVVDATGAPRDISDELFPAAGIERRHFIRVRRALGDLVRPDELARIVLARKPEIDRLKVVVIRRRLDRSSVFEERRTPYLYERPQETGEQDGPTRRDASDSTARHGRVAPRGPHS